MHTETRSTAELATDAVSHLQEIVSTELKLARAEVTENVRDVSRGAVSIAGAVAVLIPGLTVTLIAIGFALAAAGMATWLAFTLVAIFALVGGLIALSYGRKKLGPTNLMPTKTAHNLQRDAAALKEAI